MIFVKADGRVQYGSVIYAMDVARGAGVQIIGFTPQEANRQQ